MRAGAFVEKLERGRPVIEAAPRTLKVGRVYPTSTGNRSPNPVPFIRIAGKWLAKIGFNDGDILDVVISPGEIRLVRREGSPPLVNGQPDLFRN